MTSRSFQKPIHEFSVDKEVRVDRFITEMFPHCGRRRASELCENGEVLLNQRRVKSGQKAGPGDTVQFLVEVKPIEAGDKKLPQRQLQIVFEDEHILVISKPRGMHSVRQRVSEDVTVADLIAQYCPECLAASADKREAGLVQRLDFYTSGLMIAAKSDLAWQELHRMLTENRVEKSYLALVEGAVPAEPLEATGMIQTTKGSNKVSVTQQASDSTTSVQRLSSISLDGTKVSLVRASGTHFKRHQVRAHLASIGYPLVGDNIYGAKTTLDEVADVFKFQSEDDASETEGLVLHAESIRCAHPVTGKSLSIEDCPGWMELFMNQTPKAALL